MSKKKEIKEEIVVAKDVAESVAVDVLPNNSVAVPKKAFGLHRSEGGWKFCEYTILDGNIISKDETDHPTMKSICWEEFKIRSVKEFLKDG